MRIVPLFLLSLIIFFSCSQVEHHRKAYTGEYDVVVNLSEKLINFEQIKDTIQQNINQAQSEISHLNLEDKIDIKHRLESSDTDLNLLNEDSLEAQLKDIGTGLSQFAKSITNLAGQISMKSLDALSELKNHIKFNVTLNEDGTFSSMESKLGKFVLDIETWDIKDNQFIVLDDQKNIKYTFQIQSKSDVGFTLVNDDLSLEFKKK